jgi:hypothetical protein
VNRSLGLKAAGKNRSIGAHYRGGYLWLAHVQMWRGDGEPEINRWVRHCARALRTQQIRDPCTVHGCARSALGQGVCGAHRHQWQGPAARRSPSFRGSHARRRRRRRGAW